MKRLAVLATLGALASTTAQADELDLKAARAPQPIQIDGSADDTAWQAAKPLMVTVDELTYKPSTGYDGIKSTEVEIRALYDAENLYMLVRYKDPTESLRRWPWVKQKDGTWKQQSNKDSTGHENHFYEDKVSIAWNVSEKGFQKKGCEQSCHMADKGMIDGIADDSAGRHYTASPGEFLDVWHWKSARTNPVGQTDDQIINWFKKQQSPEWGRNSDAKTGGGYVDNINEAKNGPAWMPATPNGSDVFWVRADAKVPFVDTFQPGDVVGGIVIAPYEGPRGEVATRGVWKDGAWTLEIQRKLVTTGEKAKEEDVQFDDLSKTYHFGIGIFDNSQINHLYHKKAIKFSFL